MNPQDGDSRDPSGSCVLRPRSWAEALPLSEFEPATAPLEVDVGCGKGRFILARARKYPGTRFLGIESRVRRVRALDAKVQRLRLCNVRLLAVEAAYAIRYLLPLKSVSVFYVFFPDPWPKRRHHRRRLFNSDLLDPFRRALAPRGRIHAATDDPEYFDEIRRLLSGCEAFEPIPPFVPPEEERTNFETTFLNQRRTIGRCSFCLRSGPGV